MAIPHRIEHERRLAQRVLRCTPEDAAVVLRHLPATEIRRELPGSAQHAYLDDCIVKPWGHEMRIYDDRWIDIWQLRIEPGRGTSLHAHPRTDTFLVCIEGDGRLVTGAGDEIPLFEGASVRIGPGALHASFSEGGMTLIEVELPRDKLDLVRIEDRYGRAGKPYEDARSSRCQSCPLVMQAGGPPQARVRKHCVTGSFRFNLETGAQGRRRAHDLVAAIALDTSSVLNRELTVLCGDALADVTHGQLYLTARSNHR
jgi:mannose-6-phosphate isomerase-like protein (cupin superfamily)